MGRPQSKTGVQNSSIRARNEIFEKNSKMTSFGITKIAKLCSIITHRHRVGLSLDLVDFSCVDPRWSVPILRSVRAGADSESENCRFASFLRDLRQIHVIFFWEPWQFKGANLAR